MRFIPLSIIVLFLFYSCSSSDSPEEMEEQVVVNLPSLSTNSITEIGETSATVGGNISSDGGAAVTERGVVWGLSTNPTTADNKQNIGTGTGAFTATLTGLESNTTYFVRAYAVNSEGTAYGNQQQFMTLEPEPEQKVFDGDVILTSQQEVDDFGAEGYTEIAGDLTIRDGNNPATIESFESINTLQKVGGSLSIERSDQLVNLSGFIELSEIGGNLFIEANSALSSVDAFQELIAIGGNLRILNELTVFSLNGFSSLISIGGEFNLENINPGKVSEISAFESLEIIAERLAFGGVNGNVAAFDNLKEVGGGVQLTGVNSIKNLEFFNKLEIVSGEFYIGFNSSLESFEGLEKITALGGLVIVFNESLESLNGLDLNEINRLEDLRIEGNVSLLSIIGLESLQIVDERVAIRNNQKLENLDGLQGLERAGYLDIESNWVLQNISALNNLRFIDNTLNISINNALESLSGLENLEGTGMGDDQINIGRIRISGNPEIVNLDPLENLTTTWYGNIEIQNNQRLENLDGLRNVVNVYKFASDSGGFGATIENNSSLNDVCGIKNVYESNLPRYFVAGFFNGTLDPEGSASELLRNYCD